MPRTTKPRVSSRPSGMRMKALAARSLAATAVAAVAAVDRTLTEREVRMLLGSLLATGLVELSGVDRARYVATPKGIEVAEA